MQTEFKPNIELDAQIFWANHKAETLGLDPIETAAQFAKLAASIGMSDPVEGIFRALWLLTQPPTYKQAVMARVQQLIDADQNGMVN